MGQNMVNIEARPETLIQVEINNTRSWHEIKADYIFRGTSVAKIHFCTLVSTSAEAIAVLFDVAKDYRTEFGGGFPGPANINQINGHNGKNGKH